MALPSTIIRKCFSENFAGLPSTSGRTDEAHFLWLPVHTGASGAR